MRIRRALFGGPHQPAGEEFGIRTAPRRRRFIYSLLSLSLSLSPVAFFSLSKILYWWSVPCQRGSAPRPTVNKRHPSAPRPPPVPTSPGPYASCSLSVSRFGPPSSASGGGEAAESSTMVMTVVSPRRSLREAVLQSVLAYHSTQQHGRGSLYTGAGIGDEDGPGVWEEEEGTTELVQLGAERTKNVLILMSDTGGGHRASAEAIRDAFRLEFGDEYRVFVKDLCKEHAGWPLNNMERSYKFMVKHVQLWKVAFHTTSPRWVHCFYLTAIAAFYAKKVEAGLKKYKPDIIISVHPLMQHIPLWVLKSQGLQKRVVFATVITDLNTCHPTWFHKGVNRCYCPSEEVSKRAFLDGLAPSQIRVFGLPIRPSFCRAVLSKDDLRQELEMDPELPAVLLMGGGEGMGPVKKTARALGEALFNEELGKAIGQLVVICGRNQTLSSSLQAIQWKIPVKIRGFETQMEKWMGACDCIITKAGPGTIAEALIRGLPIILNDFIPGQEVGNVPYVVDNGAGVFSKSSQETASLVARWFSPESEELKNMSQNALKLAQPDAVFDIVKDMHELAQQREPIAQISYSLTSSFMYPV